MKDKTKKLLSEAERASLRAKDLTHQLLTFSKGGEPVKETSSLDKVVRESAGFVMHGHKSTCSYDIPQDLWLVDIDKGQMGQVIQNIVINALHAMPEGGAIKISCENHTSVDENVLPFAKGKFVKMCIQDSGIGIPADMVERIFDPYFSTKQEGSGLGLAIAQSILNKHNSHISVESSPGAGSTFTIYIPASEKTALEEQGLSAENIETNFQIKILLMDDEEIVRNVAKAMLVKLGHDVVLATKGEETVELYKNSLTSDDQFDLVIMDLTIKGGMGGKEAVQELLKLDPKARVLVSSGYSTDPIMANYKDYGFCSAIVKPFQLKELSMIISQAMDL